MMRTPEEKILFKNHFFKLGQGRIIPHSDASFWQEFWLFPTHASDIFELLTPYDIQIVREQNLPNLLLLIRVLCIRIVRLSPDLRQQDHQALVNCLRLLSRLLPFIFELPNYREIEIKLFWSRKFDPLYFLQSSSPQLSTLTTDDHPDVPDLLAPGLIRSLVELLFTKDFTTTENALVWEPGVGASGKYLAPIPVHDANRTDVLRLLLTLTSTSFYHKTSEVIFEGSRFATLVAVALPASLSHNLICSLLNLACRSARNSRGDSGFDSTEIIVFELRYKCLKLAMQLLATMFVYPLPTAKNTEFLREYGLFDDKPVNKFRLFFGKLTKENDLTFIISHLLGIIRSPLDLAKAESGKSTKGQVSPLSLEAIVVFWELLQCNKQLRTLFAERLVLKLAPMLLYYVFALHDVVQYSHLVKLASFFLLYLSSQDAWVQALVLPMSDATMEVFPREFQLKAPISTRDFIVIQTCQVLSSLVPVSGTRYTSIPADLQNFLLPTLAEILYNIIPATNESVEATNDPSKGMANSNPCGGLSYQTCASITRVLTQFSSRQFLLEAPRNAEMLALILRSICCAATKTPKASRMLLLSFVKNEITYDTMWNVIYSLDNEYFNGDILKLVNLNEDDEDNRESDLDPALIAGTPNLGDSSYMRSSDQHSINSSTTDEPPTTLGPKKSLSFATGLYDKEETSDNERKELEDALRPKPPSGMSEKAKEKLPQETPINKAWGGNDALRIIVTLLIPHLKVILKDVSLNKDRFKFEDFLLVKKIEHSAFEDFIESHKSQLNYDFLPHTPVDKLVFTWSHMSLGWYTSLLYWELFTESEAIKQFIGSNNNFMKNISSSLAVFGRFATSWSGYGTSAAEAKSTPEDLEKSYVENSLTSVNIWKGTNTKLFKARNETDKLLYALGAKLGSNIANAGVNDITNSLVRRFSDFRTGSRGSVTSTGSIYPSLEDVSETAKVTKRNSVSSLHTLNTLNRSRSHTPRNSFSY